MKRLWNIATAWRTLQAMAALYVLAWALDTLAWAYRVRSRAAAARALTALSEAQSVTPNVTDLTRCEP